MELVLLFTLAVCFMLSFYCDVPYQDILTIAIIVALTFGYSGLRFVPLGKLKAWGASASLCFFFVAQSTLNPGVECSALIPQVLGITRPLFLGTLQSVTDLALFAYAFISLERTASRCHPIGLPTSSIHPGSHVLLSQSLRGNSAPNSPVMWVSIPLDLLSQR